MVGTAGALAIVSKHIQLDMRHKMNSEKAHNALVEETPSLNLSLQTYYFLKLTVNKNENFTYELNEENKTRLATS